MAVRRYCSAVTNSPRLGASAPEHGSTGCLRYLDGPPQANTLRDSLSRADIAPNAVRLDTVHRWSRWSRAGQVLQRRQDSAPQRSPRGHTGGGLLHLAPHQLSAAARDPYNRRRQETLYATGSPASTLRAKRSEEHTSELQSPDHLVCRLLLEKK